jgi:two-component system NtrC family sensor kinase
VIVGQTGPDDSSDVLFFLGVDDHYQCACLFERDRVLLVFATRDRGQGTGLGLLIAFDVVRSHGGIVDYSRVDSGGARFVTRLPLHNRVEVSER